MNGFFEELCGSGDARQANQFDGGFGANSPSPQIIGPNPRQLAFRAFLGEALFSTYKRVIKPPKWQPSLGYYLVRIGSN
jgi:hypothetical protein